MTKYEVAKPPVMWFKMDKYRAMGDKYMDTMKELVDMSFDKYNVPSIYFNILFVSNNETTEMTAKEPLNKDEIFDILLKIETIEGAKIIEPQ